jgi:phosphatidylserine decarboxylase
VRFGLLCFVAVGMAEVSSCVLSVKQGQHVNKGEEIGFFQFGGSSHCLVFRRGAVAAFALQSIPQGEHGANSPIVKVNSLCLNLEFPHFVQLGRARWWHRL